MTDPCDCEPGLAAAPSDHPGQGCPQGPGALHNGEVKEHGEHQDDAVGRALEPLDEATAQAMTAGIREAIDDVRRSVVVLAARVRDAHASGSGCLSSTAFRPLDDLQRAELPNDVGHQDRGSRVLRR